jgi:hypothetical protein
MRSVISTATMPSSPIRRGSSTYMDKILKGLLTRRGVAGWEGQIGLSEI